VNYLKKMCCQALNYLLPKDISVQDKFSNMIYVSTLIGSIGTLIVSMILTPNIMTLLTILAAIVVISISIFLAVFKRRHKSAALIVILFINEAIFPIMYFYNGGIHSGMQIWFVIGLSFCFLVLEGRPGIITFVIGSITLSGCFILETLGIIVPQALEGNIWSFDVIQSMILVSAIFGVFVKFQTSLYKEQNKELIDRELELVESKEEAENANKAKTVFIANMSHEIRTPITAIMGLNEIIVRETQEDGTRNYAEQMLEAGKSLLSIVNNILDITKIEAGKIDILPEEYRLSSLIDNCCRLVRFRAENKGIELKVDIDTTIPDELIGDKYHISRILTNLLTNAVKYTEEGAVELSVTYEQIETDKINLIISVKDSGVGISEEDINKIFIAFQRIDLKRNRSVEGTGLGLAIVSSLIEQMDGKINVASELGIGSVFTITLPQTVSYQKEEAIDNREPDISDPENKSKVKVIAPTARILIVDDIKLNLFVIGNLLKPLQVQLDTAENGEKALELSAQIKYDLILMDYMMPEMDGVEVFKILRETQNINQKTPVVVVTANVQQGIDEEYREIGFDDYIAKPMKPQILEMMVLKFLPESKIEKYLLPD